MHIRIALTSADNMEKDLKYDKVFQIYYKGQFCRKLFAKIGNFNMYRYLSHRIGLTLSFTFSSVTLRVPRSVPLCFWISGDISGVKRATGE